MRTKGVSIAKPEPGVINEDAVIARPGVIAVADGAGGGGMFAERWSQYLLDHLPETPLASFEELDSWIDGIWEPFYNECELRAKGMGGMVLGKFYEEGSFATLAAIWRQGGRARWVTYGDSVAFCYDRLNGTLQFSLERLSEFNEAPYLVSCKDPLLREGFACGEFESCGDKVCIVASDALAHYVLMMYMVSKKEEFHEQLACAMKAHGKNATFVKSAMSLPQVDFDAIIKKLLNCVGNSLNFARHLARIRAEHLLAVDDYSLACMTW